MPDRPWNVVRVTHGTWAQDVVSRHRRRTTAQIIAKVNTTFGLISRAWGDRSSYEVWRDA